MAIRMGMTIAARAKIIEKANARVSKSHLKMKLPPDRKA
jgi:hypothetical protein